MMSNKRRGTIYTGMTNDIVKRTIQHKQKLIPGFTSRYNLNKLVWFEEYEWVQDAIAREKEIKGWKREKKIALIESVNPEWEDLFRNINL